MMSDWLGIAVLTFVVLCLLAVLVSPVWLFLIVGFEPAVVAGLTLIVLELEVDF